MWPNITPSEAIGNQPDFTRGRALKAALALAGRGKPIFPVKHAPAKTPLTTNGFKDATTNRQRIIALWNAHPGASIGVPAGEESGWWVLDVDRLAALGELPAELPVTLTVRTPSGGLHYYFKHDPRIGCGAGNLPKDIHVRGGGRGYTLIPPSPGYRWEVREEIATAPEWLIAMIVEPKNPQPTRRNVDPGQPTLDLGGPPILEGERHTTMTSVAGRLHDGTRTAQELQRDLISINEGRCVPPLPMAEVESIARWTSEKEPCSSGRPAELEAMIDRLSAAWFRLERRGLGGKNEVRLVRLLLEAGNRVGTVVADGLRISISLRQMAEKLSCGVGTVRAVRDRLAARGLLRVDNSEVGRRTATGTGSAALVLIARDELDTPPNDPLYISEVGGGVWKSSRINAATLKTAHYRHRGPVGYSREDSLCWIESHPGATRDELATLMGWSRSRDLEARHLRPLEDLGLIEDRGGRWTVSDRYAEAQQDVKLIAYSTVQMRSARQWDPEAGRWTHYVAETGSIASQQMRERWDIERHRQQRSLWKLALAAKKAAAEESCQQGPIIVEHAGDLVNLETGEVVGWIGEPEEAEDEHRDGCQCVECEYGRLKEVC